ncbi:MAG: hypothetical protein K1X67_11120 [Fimbriimonadaceae bacterium]|nr:hypothetical protein [Fimbriimonadaceae bacterium]
MRWLVLGLVLALGGCQPKPETPSPAARAPLDPWVTATRDPLVSTPALLWNGLIGVRFGRDGTGLGSFGLPQPTFKIDEYETTGEEKIRTLANPFADTWAFEGKPIDLRQSKNYDQRLEFKTGILTTSYDVEIGGVGIRVTNQTAIHPDQPVIVQRWSITPSRACTYRFTSAVARMVLPPGYEYQPNLKPSIQFEPLKGDFQDAINAHVRIGHRVGGALNPSWSEPTTSLVHDGQIEAGVTLVLEKTASFEFQGPWLSPLDWDYAKVAAASECVWRTRWQTDIEIDGPVEDQLAVRSFLFYLRSAIHPKGKMSIAPFGLSEDLYGGHIFWDADVWVFPVLVLTDPALAMAIPDYRLRMMGTGSGPYRFAWQSSVTGKDVAPADPQLEIHLSGGVVWSMQMAADLGLMPQNTVDRVGRRVAEFYLKVATGPANALELHNVMSPDEFHIGNNDLYTNMIAEWVVRRYGPPDRRGVTFYKPKDATGFLTYDHDKLRGYKQAAALLSVFPLQNPEAEAQAKTLLDRFASKVTKSGPAMSDSVHATIFARIGDTEKAYDAWRKGWMEFTDHPLMLFTEKRNKDLAYFTTGAAGCLQSVIYGFLGFRFDSKKDPKAAWSTRLEGGAWLNIRPNLPPAWKSVRFKNFTVLGKRYDLTATPTSVKVTQGVP